MMPIRIRSPMEDEILLTSNRDGRILKAKNVPITMVIHRNARRGLNGQQLLITAAMEIIISSIYITV